METRPMEMEIPQIIEAILFVAGEPVAISDLSVALGLSELETTQAIEETERLFEQQQRIEEQRRIENEQLEAQQANEQKKFIQSRTEDLDLDEDFQFEFLKLD